MILVAKKRRYLTKNRFDDIFAETSKACFRAGKQAF
jgi:hypothetical protein